MKLSIYCGIHLRYTTFLSLLVYSLGDQDLIRRARDLQADFEALSPKISLLSFLLEIVLKLIDVSREVTVFAYTDKVLVLIDDDSYKKHKNKGKCVRDNTLIFVSQTQSVKLRQLFSRVLVMWPQIGLTDVRKEKLLVNLRLIFSFSSIKSFIILEQKLRGVNGNLKSFERKRLLEDRVRQVLMSMVIFKLNLDH
ncbi:hypothetical protein HZH68_014203 [Vespula germanica]|uniref:Uncharacterized protein n=1 Tax=Vespula germanica TaxID=30212 RepID=A0A834J9T4_VESGE|nr:hypothetical protein HZH68_014203 [Vespula germanica]